MSQIQQMLDGTILASVETLAGDVGGAVGVDGSFNINVLGGTGLTITGVPATNTLTLEVDAQENIIYVAKHGNDANSGLNIENAKLTIQSAVTAAIAGDTILVSPGTYTETVTHAASNVTLIAEGKSTNVIITQADANVIDFATFTGIQYKGFQISCSAATTAIWTITGSTGSCSFKECQLSMTSAADIAAVAQPGTGRVTGAGTLTVILGKVFYYHTGNGGATAQKGAFSVANGGTVALSLIEELTIVNSGTALVSSVGIDLATTGVFEIHNCIINVTDPDSTVVAGFAYVGGTGIAHEYYRNTIHVTATNNIGYGFYSDDTATTSRFFYNHIHVTDAAGSSYSYYVGAGSTVISQFEDLLADDGVSINATGIFCEVSSEIDGDLTASCAKAGGIEQITIANTDNTATASYAALNLSVGGTTSTGDPYVNWFITGSNTYSMGIDNSEADVLKITTGANPSAASTIWEMTTVGERTMPLQPAFLANLTTSILNVTGNGTAYVIIFDNEVFDQGGDFNLGISTFSTPKTGVYIFLGNVVAAQVATATAAEIRFVTSNRQYITAINSPDAVKNAGGSAGYNISCLADMDAADICHFRITLTGIGADTADITGIRAWFCGKLVC